MKEALRSEEEMSCKDCERNLVAFVMHLRGFIMLWGCFSASAIKEMTAIEGNMVSKSCQTILSNRMKSCVNSPLISV